MSMLLLVLPLKDYLVRLAEPHLVADMLIVCLLVYAALKLLRGTRAAPLVAAIGVFAILYWVAVNQRLVTFEFVLRAGLLYIGVAIIILFQSEIRQSVIRLANRIHLPATRRHRGQFGASIYDEIVLAATTLASTKTGALIVIERDMSLNTIADAGVKLDAQLSYDLIVSIFNPSSPLHDGAIVVRGDRIASASSFLPLSLNPTLSKEFGTRHRAAVGITEDSDAVVIVVSEETGLMSFVRGGRINRALDATRLRAAIFQTIEGNSRHDPSMDSRSSDREGEEALSA